MTLNKINKNMIEGLPQDLTNITSQLADTKQKEVVGITDFGAVGDFFLPDHSDVTSTKNPTPTDDTIPIQENATACDYEKIPYMYLPSIRDYYITESIKFNEPGVKIYGDKAPSYDRGIKKRGYLIIGGSEPKIALDLGNYRTAGNIADMWTVSNIGIKSASGVIDNKKGIAFTSQNNGPDRGAIISEVSLKNLEAGVYIPPTDKQVSLACLVIENSNLSTNGYGLWSEGAVYGLRFVGNQAEQNRDGAIHGMFSGAITVSDNMLEGQKNPINIKGTGASIKFISENNYFETNDINGSEYVYQLETGYEFLRNYARFSGNFTSGNKMPPDVIRIKGVGKWLLDIQDRYPLTLHNASFSVVKGSKIFASDIDYYRIRSIDTTKKMPELYIDNGLAFPDVSNSHTHVSFTSENGVQMMTPVGMRYVYDGKTNSPTINVPASAGNLFVLNMLVRAKNIDATAVTFSIYNHNGSWAIGAGASHIFDISGGEWVLVSMPIYNNTANLASGFQVRYVVTGNADIHIGGIAVKNYGAFVNDGTQVINVSPVTPNLV